MLDIFHVHTYRCGHAENVSDEVYIQKALELGADRITFTDHAPFPGDIFFNRMQYEQLPEYVDTLEQLKRKYEGQILVRIGLEIEYLPSFQSYYEELAGILDLLMIGQHFFEAAPGRYSFSLPDQQEIEYPGCVEAMLRGIETNLFQVVAHPDRVFRRIKRWNQDCEEKSRELICLAQSKDVILEKNLSSMRHKNYYREEFWDLLHPENRTIFGLDVHSVEELELVQRVY